jgi:hypothetical protein
MRKFLAMPCNRQNTLFSRETVPLSRIHSKHVQGWLLLNRTKTICDEEYQCTTSAKKLPLKFKPALRSCHKKD